MKIFQVSLSKSYLVNIVANDEEKAKRLAGFYASDILDVSNENERLNEIFYSENRMQTQ